jgi:predicted O-methyltransferase YrrM
MQDNGLVEHLLEQRKLIEKLRKEASAKKIPVIGKSTGYLLGYLVKVFRPSNILEIGCGSGFSSYFILENMAGSSSYTGIDMNCQRLEDARDLISRHFPGKDHNFMCGNALKLIPGLSKIFDLVFIDAAKFEYPLYLEAVKEKIREGTIIIADDIFCKNNIFTSNPPGHFDNSVKGLRRYLRSVKPGKGFNTVLLDIDDGLSISVYSGGDN